MCFCRLRDENNKTVLLASTGGWKPWIEKKSKIPITSFDLSLDLLMKINIKRNNKSITKENNYFDNFNEPEIIACRVSWSPAQSNILFFS